LTIPPFPLEVTLIEAPAVDGLYEYIVLAIPMLYYQVFFTLLNRTFSLSGSSFFMYSSSSGLIFVSSSDFSEALTFYLEPVGLTTPSLSDVHLSFCLSLFKIDFDFGGLDAYVSPEGSNESAVLAD